MKRLTAYPALREHLDKLQSKVFVLSSDADVTPIEVKESELEIAADVAVERIKKSKFTSKGDKDKVISLYEEYARNTVGALTKTLGSLQMLASHRATAAPAEPLPQVDAPAASSLCLAEGQPLLLLSWQGSGSGPGSGPRFGVVDATGGRVAAAVTGKDEAELAYDRCSQAVLPWRPPAVGWDAAFVGDARALRDLAEPARRLAEDARRMESESALHIESESTLRSIGVRAREIADSATQGLLASQTIAQAAHEAGAAVRSCVDAAADEAAELFKLHSRKGQEPGDQLEAALGKVRVAIGKVCEAIERLQPEAMVTAALRSSGASGARRYATGQPLTVRTSGGWRDADVARSGADGLCHFLEFEGSGEPPATLTLHPWNHAPRELPHAAYEAMRDWWARSLRANHARIADALTGKRLDALQQCVAINVTGGAAETQASAIRDAHSLAAWLLAQHGAQLEGGPTEGPLAVLLTAGPASGKTTLLSQVVIVALQDERAELVPILVKVQVLQRRLLEAPDAFAGAWNYIDAFLRLEHEASRPALYRMLRQAMMARRALLLLDGLDEAGAKRDDIERHVVDVLAPQGHVLLCTSRPAGVDEARFAAFRRLSLAPLSDEQQERALEQRLGAERAAALLTYVRDVMPRDDTGQKVTSNPLMLSMVASVYELRQGVGMTEEGKHKGRRGVITADDKSGNPYKVTFADDGTVSGWLKPDELRSSGLVGEVATLQRAMDASAPTVRAECEMRLSVALHEALRTVRERVLVDALPLLSLWQSEPLQLQSSHLSFQEYFAAIALCEEGTELSGTPPWQWPAWWANAVKLGAEIPGDRFGHGLLRAAGVTGDTLDLSQQLGGDRPTVRRVLAAVVANASELRTLNLSQNKLDAEDARALAPTLMKTTALKNCSLLKNSLDVESATMLAKIGTEKGIMLSGMKRDQTVAEFNGQSLQPADAILIGSDLQFMAVVTSVDLRANSIGVDGAKAIAEALKVNAVLTSVDLQLNSIGDDGAKAIAEDLKVNAVVTTLGLMYNNIGPEGAIAIAEALKVNAVLTTLNLGYNSIGVEGAMAIAEALKVNAVLTMLWLGGNEIGDVGAKAIAEALKVNAVLTELSLWDNNIGVDGAIAIAEALKVNAVLTTLRLSGNNIGVEGAKAIAEALKVNAVLTKLDLDDNEIGPEGAIAIAEALKVNAVLTELELGFNSIGDDGAKAIAEALKVNAVLTKLRLNDNEIGDDGAKAIAEALKVNAVVTTLDLGDNRFGVEGAKAIAEALKVNAVLTTLDLSQNYNIGDDGAKAIAEALKVNAVVTTLDLGRNKIGDEGAKAIAEALKVNAVLTYLSLGSNFFIGDEGAKAIAEALKVNAVLTTLDLSQNYNRPKEMPEAILRLPCQTVPTVLC
jgi:Ran GTPase-activating protein (RanGAP) involved in mRNA processing and transport